MLYTVVLVSAVEQSESAICIHISPYPLPLEPSSHTSIPPLKVITEHQAEHPVLYSSFPLAIYLTHRSAYVSVLLSQFIPPPPSPHVHKSVLYVCISFPALQIGHHYHFARFQTCALIYDIFFSLSDLLHPV